MTETDFISGLISAGVPEISEKILSFLDARSLARAETVCQKWREVILNAERILWRKLLDRNVSSNPLWKKLGYRMGWLKELADLSADKVPLQKSSFRDIYFSASRALHRLDKNWELGEYNLSKINLSSDDYIFSLLVDVDKIVCGLFDKTIKFWDRKTLQCYRTLECPDFMWCLKWNSEVLVASFQNEFELNVWDIRSGNLLNAFENPLEHQVDRT